MDGGSFMKIFHCNKICYYFDHDFSVESVFLKGAVNITAEQKIFFFLIEFFYQFKKHN
jgi:hypothetical protein